MPKTDGAGRCIELICAVVVLAVAAWFYGWTATSAGSPLTSRLQKDDLYNRLSDGFLAGQLSFVEKPSPELAKLADPWDPAQNAPYASFHDVTYYRGKFFLYFGPAPAVVLLTPWKALTGSYLGQNVAAALFALLGAAASMALVIVLRRRHFPYAPGWIGGVCMVAVAFCSFAPVVLRRPISYELAITSAYAFAMGAFLCMALALGSGRQRRLWLALSSLAYGLTVASRPNYLFGAIVLGAPFLSALRTWRACGEVDVRGLRRDLLAAALPFIGIGVLLLAYNYRRFGSVAEFGTSYMLSGLHPQRDVVTTLRFIPVNIWFYLCAPAQFSAFFPFFQVIHMPWFHLPKGYIGEENIYGVLTNMPFFWMLWFLRGAWRDARLPAQTDLRDFARGVFALVGLNALVLFRISGAANRYLLDLLPPLVPLACIGIFWLEQSSRTAWRRAAGRALWLGAIAFTAVFNVFVSFQHNDLLKYHNPGAYRRLAHAFNHVSVWLGQTAPSKVGPLRVRLKFPSDRAGNLEPLVVTGLSFRADFLWVYYVDENHVKIGFEHTSYGGPVTDLPVEINYDVDHVLEIEMGSLYPPIEHPFYDHLSGGEVSRLKRTLRVVFDGKEILWGSFDFYDSSPGDVSVGFNPVSDAFGRRFTGKITGVERLGLKGGG